MKERESASEATAGDVNRLESSVHKHIGIVAKRREKGPMPTFIPPHENRREQQELRSVHQKVDRKTAVEDQRGVGKHKCNDTN